MADIPSPACRGLHDRLYIFISVCPIEICSSPWQMSLSPLPSLTDPWGLARLSPVIAQEEGPLLIGRPVMVGTPSDDYLISWPAVSLPARRDMEISDTCELFRPSQVGRAPIINWPGHEVWQELDSDVFTEERSHMQTPSDNSFTLSAFLQGEFRAARETSHNSLLLDL